MLNKSLAIRLFDAFSIQRWNEKIRPVELVEMDKTAHKMIIAWCLGRCEEDAGRAVDWERLINGGIFELMRRIVISDIKSPIYNRIREEHPDVFRELNEWVYRQMEAHLDDQVIREEFRSYLMVDAYLDKHTRLVLDAAHLYATFWEFRIIRHTNPRGYQIEEIHTSLMNRMEPFLDLVGMRRLVTNHPLASFIDLCGQLRFQIRWGQTPRIPRTSVLGHMMLVACLSWFFSREVGACARRSYNNFFGGLLHDLPEAVTRDIISPVKSSVERLPDVIANIEKQLAEREIFGLLPQTWKPELAYLIQDEFDSKIRQSQDEGRKPLKVSSADIGSSFNADGFDPYDGELVRVADHLSAFLEAYMSAQYGIRSESIDKGLRIGEKYAGQVIAGIDVGRIYAAF
ncbi:HD domain-containing protein [Desulfocurvibacter africanus]|uniref:HD domain-containing protein n=1 Tax=Desulfocurvibacter africanus TaxID=873 RepID=UPI002FDAA3A0